MRNSHKQPIWSAVLASVGIAAVGAAIAGSATARSTEAHAAAATPTIQMVEGTAPQSLDPGLDYTTQGAEVNWLVYTGLTTYSRQAGNASTALIPGLGTALPKISNGGKTYTVTLRKGLKFSNGHPVVASDFTFTVERALSIPWGGASTFIEPNIVGAAAFASHKAKGISGITTNNATGKIVIHLTHAYGPFDNVLAFASLGLIDPATVKTLDRAQPSDPPAGAGPYKVTNIVPNASYDVVKNPEWKSIPGISNGYVNVDVKIDSNVSANADAVLNNSADIFDWADTIPGSYLSKINSTAKSRFHLVDMGGTTYYIFLNMQKPPFNNQLAREAVVTGLNEDAMSRLGGGTLVPACFFLPPALPGHPTAKCPYGTPGLGSIAKAKQLVKKSRQANVPITIYSEERTPRLQWMEQYESELKAIGFKNVTLKEVADSNYFTVIGESKSVDPQTGFADWNQDFPNPIDFYGVLLDGNSITPTDNENFGQTNDPYVNKEVTKLGATPTTELSKVKGQWQKLDEYVAKKAYAAVFGYQKFPFFTSNRIVQSPLNINYIYGWDFSELRVK
ncbi:MAG: ABC transporter substrate-binding protein [Solirubrobacteraceae bacterium]